MHRKRYEPIRQESPDEPFGPLQEAYLYRCLVCSERYWFMKPSLMGPLARPNSTGDMNIHAGYPR
jgi:hypothetical protein